MSTRSLLIRVSLVVLMMVVALVGVLQVVRRPVSGETATFTAMFTDANGLRAGDDVRLYGVQVGKVSVVELDDSLARVRFTVATSQALFTNSKLAVRFQNLSGFRYLDIEQPEQPGDRRKPQSVFGTSETIPAFDITTLFKGLQPMLAQLSPDDLNQFATSLLAVIQGDGSGLGPALDAIDKLSRYASDRQAVVSTLVANLGQIANHLGGKSGSAIELLSNLTNLYTAITEKLPGLISFSQTIPPVLQPIRDMLTVLGLTGDRNKDLDALLHKAFPDPQQAVAVFGRLPSLIQTIASTLPPTGPDAQLTCSKGVAVAPEPLQVLIAGQRIALCHR